MEPYNEKVIENYANPKNVGKILDADGIGEVGNPVCGDIMKIYLKIENNKIVDVKFQTFGCGAAIASSSISTQMVKGKTLDEALQLTNKDVIKELGGLPAVKLHCSVLAEEAIREAIADYYFKQGIMTEEEIIAKCKIKKEKSCKNGCCVASNS